MADLSFEAESPLAPPAELLDRLPSYDWLLQGGGKSANAWLCSLFLGPGLVGETSLERARPGQLSRLPWAGRVLGNLLSPWGAGEWDDSVSTNIP